MESTDYLLIAAAVVLLLVPGLIALRAWAQQLPNIDPAAITERLKRLDTNGDWQAEAFTIRDRILAAISVASVIGLAAAIAGGMVE
jgi:hypothetical protein